VLPREGALPENYYGIGHDSLDNYIAEISGQAPEYQTGQDCEYFTRFLQFGGETYSKWTKYDQLSGDGCVYPPYVRNIASQLNARHLTWKSYDQDMGIDPRRDGTAATPTVERIFGVALLGDARQPQMRAFGADIFTR
jgi:hypothetical protein